MRVIGAGRQVERVVDEQEPRDDDGLGDLAVVVGYLDVGVVEGAEVDEGAAAEPRLQRPRHHHLRDAEVDQVDDEHGHGGDGGDEELVPPADVEQVVADAEQHDRLQREDGGEVERELQTKP